METHTPLLNPPFHFYAGCKAEYDGDQSFTFLGVDPITKQPVLHGEWPGCTHPVSASPACLNWDNFKLVLRHLHTMTMEEFIEIESVRHAPKNEYDYLFSYARQIVLLCKKGFHIGLIPDKYIVITYPDQQSPSAFDPKTLFHPLNFN